MDRINVTKTALPSIETYIGYVKKIWDNNYLTNQGPLLHEFEAKMKEYNSVEDFHFVGNGTIALQLALNALDITEGEVITTPFSYVATVSSIMWERCTPIFVDIDEKTLSIDPKKIEEKITSKTKAIMPVHVFGIPCDIEGIQRVANKHNLKVIYDAAQAFGVKYKGKSLLSYGDISTCSFHSTKVFQTIEGGCVVAKSKEVSGKVELIKRFGHTGDDHFVLGINGKASEFQAAMGLSVLPELAKNIDARKKITELYDSLLNGKFKKPLIPAETDYNYSYYPIVIENEEETVRLITALNKANIFPRRYFYPALNTLPYIADTQSCPIAEDISKRILCLPLYPELENTTVHKICEIIT